MVAGRTLKSGFEGKVGTALIAAGFPVKYETTPFIWQPDPKIYKPDYELHPKLFIEAKGRFSTDDQEKMLNVRRASPDVAFVLLFERPNARCYRRMTCAQWAERHGFRWITLAELPAFLEEVRPQCTPPPPL